MMQFWKIGILCIFDTVVKTESHPAIALDRNDSDQTRESVISWSTVGATRMQIDTDKLA